MVGIVEFKVHIAVPDFFAGAMENWGLVIYREEFLLFNENTDSFKKQKRIFEIIYHEVAHQWVSRSTVNLMSLFLNVEILLEVRQHCVACLVERSVVERGLRVLV